MSTAISATLLDFTLSLAFFCFWCKTSQPQAKQEIAQKLPKYQDKTTSPYLISGFFSFFFLVSVGPSFPSRTVSFFYATTMAPVMTGIVKPGVLILRLFYRINKAEKSAPLLRLDYNFHQEG